MLTAAVKTDPLRERRTTKTIAVYTDAPDDGFIRLSLSFTTVPAISVLPARFLSIRTDEGERGSARLALRRTDGEELRITDSRVELPVELEVRTERATDGETLVDGSRVEPGDLWVELSVPSSAPAGRRRGSLTLATNHPQLKTIELPIHLWVRSIIDVRPATVRLWLYEDDPRPGPVNIQLIHADQLPFTLAGVEVSHPDMFEAVPETKGAVPRHVVRVAALADVDRSAIQDLIRGWLRISIAGPSPRSLEVPVTLGVRSAVSGRRVPPAPTGTPTGFARP
jgi:hypothetical protein